MCINVTRHCQDVVMQGQKRHAPNISFNQGRCFCVPLFYIPSSPSLIDYHDLELLLRA